MRDLCLDEGILQSYVDGQLEPEALERVTSHLATCTVCSDAARQVENEMELTAGAFAAEMSLSVPSELLRSRLDHAIAGLNAQPLLKNVGARGRVQTWLSSFASAFNLSPQRAVGYASILIFFVLAAVVGGMVMRQRDSQFGVAVVPNNQTDSSALAFESVAVKANDTNDNETTRRAVARRFERPRAPRTAQNDQAVLLSHRMLPGEKNYLQAISVLTEAIEANGESSLKPTLLADYKLNLEVVNQAITATQRTARTNPKSPDAAEMLFAVYQSKLDLLSAVAEQTRPMIAQR